MSSGRDEGEERAAGEHAPDPTPGRRRRRAAVGGRPAGRDVARAAGQVAVVDDLGPAGRERPGRRTACSPCTSACSMTNSPPGRSSRAASAMTARGHGQAVRAPAVQRDLGVVVAHLGVDRLLARRHVRRVADDDVDPAEPGRRAPSSGARVGDVAGSQVDPAGRERGDVGRGPGPGRLAHLDRDDPARRAPRSRRRGRSPPSRRRGRRRRPHRSAPSDGPGRVDGGAGDVLGLRPRHEHARPDRQLEVAERRPAGQVLERHPAGPLGDQVVVPLGRRSVPPTQREPGHLGCARRRAGGPPAARRRRAGSAHRPRPAARWPRRSRPASSGASAGAAARPVGQSPTAASWAASSASMADCTTSSRSPSRIWSSLYAL